MAEQDTKSFPAALWLCILLAAGAALRFYQLGTPSLWLDEILVPLTASHPVEYILDFCRSAEMHPPLFYLISKAAMGLGVTDFALRFLPAVLGMAGLYSLYRVVEEFDGKDTALMAVALLAVNGLHVLLSREIRPYTVQMLALVWAWLLIVRLAKRGRWRDLAGLCAINAMLFTLHYFTFHMVFAQGVALVASRLGLGGKVRLGQLAVFCGATLAAALPVFVFFFLPSSGSRSIFTDTQYSSMDVWKIISNYVVQAVFFFDVPWFWMAGLLLALAGLVVLWRRDRLAVAIVAILAVVPLANVQLLGKAAYFSPWHVAYLTLFLSYLTAVFLVWAVPAAWARTTLALAIVLAGTVYIFTVQAPRFYQPDSYKHNVFITMYKMVAKRLAAALGPGGPVVASNPGFANGVNWYLDQFASPNRLRVQSLEPEDGVREVRFLSAYKDFSPLAKDEASFLAAYGPPRQIQAVENATMYTLPLERQPVTIMDKLPFTAKLGLGLKGFYGHVYRMEDVTLNCQGISGITPTSNTRPGSFEYVLENAAGSVPQTIFVNLLYKNVGRSNLLGLFYRFDDENLIPLAGTRGPDPKCQLRTIIKRDKPYKRLTFRCELRAAPLTAQYHGGNLETLLFKELQVYVCPADGIGACQTPWEIGYQQSLQSNYVAEVFLASSAIPHTVHWDKTRNIEDMDTQEVKGWRVFTPKDPAQPATLALTVTPGRKMLFYPRISQPESTIQVFDVAGDGTRQELFLMRGEPQVWSPMSAQFVLELPEGGREPRSLEIKINGRGTQIWHKDQTIIF